MSLLVNPQLLLTCLERFENQAYNVINDSQCVELFCKEVIPFLEKNPTIDALRQHWEEHRAYLNQQVEETSTQALLETTETYQELKKALLDSDNPWICQKMTLIDRQFKEGEKSLGSPLYGLLYDELKGLLQLLLTAGHEDLCTKYAKLITRQIYVQKNPQQTDRWVRVLDRELSYLLTALRSWRNYKKDI